MDSAIRQAAHEAGITDTQAWAFLAALARASYPFAPSPEDAPEGVVSLLPGASRPQAAMTATVANGSALEGAITEVGIFDSQASAFLAALARSCSPWAADHPDQSLADPVSLLRADLVQAAEDERDTWGAKPRT